MIPSQIKDFLFYPSWHQTWFNYGMIVECGLRKAGLVLVAVSGGADSLALLHVLRGADYPLLVASFNHRLRPEAESDVAHVRQIAEGMGLPFVTDSADVAAHAGAEGLSIEEAARDLRYRFLFREARRTGAQAVAVGHTADDQAETVLMHFLRGAGLAGLKGMTPRVILPVFDAEIPLVRPLLAWTRAQTESYCREHDLDYLTDATNTDTTYFRNKLRHELLPQLETYNPQIRQTLAKTALTLQGDHELLAEMVDSAWEQVVSASGADFAAFDLAQLRSLSPALRRHLFRRAAFALKPGLRNVDFDALERAARLQAVDLAGGLKIIIEGNCLYLTGDEDKLPVDVPQISGQYSVSSDKALPSPVPPAQVSGGVAAVEGRSSLYEIALEDGWVLTCETLNTEDCSLNTDPFTAYVNADLSTGSLRLRPFRAGDRFEPLGMPGQTVKLSDLFTNLKIPKRLRKKWPLLLVGDEIAWVVGLRTSERFKVTAAARRVLHLQIKRLP
jgi:tRNA(Ile)-lysidine synthase